MAQVRYFPRYSQRENFQTNNTLLLLYRLYDYSRFRFEKFLSGLLRHANTEPGSALTLELQITQQVGTGAGIVDGFLNQESLRIAIEAKRSSEGFYPEQINRFLSGFNPPNGGFLILLSSDHVQIDGPDWSDVAASAKVKNVTLVPVTFENIISAAKECLHPYDEEMHDLVTDYEEFCSDEELLPVDKWTLFAPPCGLSHEINVANQLYFCPASWSRRRARYLGIYYDKAVRHIGTIVKVVECEINKDGGVHKRGAFPDGGRAATNRQGVERRHGATGMGPHHRASVLPMRQND